MSGLANEGLKAGVLPEAIATFRRGLDRRYNELASAMHKFVLKFQLPSTPARLSFEADATELGLVGERNQLLFFCHGLIFLLGMVVKPALTKQGW